MMTVTARAFFSAITTVTVFIFTFVLTSVHASTTNIAFSSICDSTMPMVSITDTDVNTSYTASFSAGGTGYHGLYFYDEGTYELIVQSPPLSASFSVKASCSTEDIAYIVRERTLNNERTEHDLHILISTWRYSSFIVEVIDKEKVGTTTTSYTQKLTKNITFTLLKVDTSKSLNNYSQTVIESVPHLGMYDTATGKRVFCNISGTLSLRQGNWYTVKTGVSETMTLDVCPNEVDISQPLSVFAKIFTDSNLEFPITPNTIVQFGTVKDTPCKITWVSNPDTDYIIFVSSSTGLRSGAYTLKIYGNTSGTSIVNDICEHSDTSAGIVESVAHFSEKTERNGTRWFGFRTSKKSQGYRLKVYCQKSTANNEKNDNLSMLVKYDCNESTVFDNASNGVINFVSPTSYVGQPYKVAVDGCDGKLGFEIRSSSAGFKFTVDEIIFVVIASIILIVLCGMIVVCVRNRSKRLPFNSDGVSVVSDAFDDDEIEFEINNSTDKDSLIINTDY